MRGSPLSPGNTSHPPGKGDQAPAKSRHLLPRPVISIGPSRARRSASGAKWGVKGEGEGGIQSASPARPASVCGEVCSVLQFPRRWTRCSPRGEEMGEWVGLAVANDDRTSHDDRSVEREVIQFPSLTLAGLARRVPLSVSTGSPEQRRFSPDQPLPHFQRGAFPAETAVELSGKERTGGRGKEAIDGAMLQDHKTPRFASCDGKKRLARSLVAIVSEFPPLFHVCWRVADLSARLARLG